MEKPNPHGEQPHGHPGESSLQPLPLAARWNFNYFSLSMLHRKMIMTAPKKGSTVLKSISINYAWVNILHPHLTAISTLPGAEQAEVAPGQTHLSCGLPKTNRPAQWHPPNQSGTYQPLLSFRTVQVITRLPFLLPTSRVFATPGEFFKLIFAASESRRHCFSLFFSRFFSTEQQGERKI